MHLCPDEIAAVQSVLPMLPEAWGGCRGQHTATRADLQGWADHYKMALGDFLDPPPATE